MENTSKWNQPHKAAKRTESGVSVWRGAIAALVVVVGAAIAFWLIGGHDSEGLKPKEKPQAKTSLDTPKPAANRPSESKGNEAQDARPVRLEGGVAVVSESVRTNQSGAVVEKLKLADGRLIEKVHPPKSIFSNPSDQMIAVALSAKPGLSMAPLPNLSTIENDFANSLLEPIVIDESDSEKVRDLKLAVMEARAYIAAEVRNGRTVQECLNEHRDQMERIADSHQMAIEEIQKMKADGASSEEMLEFRMRVNEVFREKGLPELPMPGKN